MGRQKKTERQMQRGTGGEIQLLKDAKKERKRRREVLRNRWGERYMERETVRDRDRCRII